MGFDITFAAPAAQRTLEEIFAEAQAKKAAEEADRQKQAEFLLKVAAEQRAQREADAREELAAAAAKRQAMLDDKTATDAEFAATPDGSAASFGLLQDALGSGRGGSIQSAQLPLITDAKRLPGVNAETGAVETGAGGMLATAKPADTLVPDSGSPFGTYIGNANTVSTLRTNKGAYSKLREQYPVGTPERTQLDAFEAAGISAKDAQTKIQTAQDKSTTKAPALGSFGDFLARGAAAKGKNPEDLTPQDVLEAKKAYDAAGRKPEGLGSSVATDSDIEALAQNIAQNPDDLTSLNDVASLRGQARLKAYNRIKQLDPSFDPGLIDQRRKFLTNYENVNGKSAQNRLSLNSVLKHGAELQDYSVQYARSDKRFLNTPLNEIANQNGDGRYTSYLEQMDILKDEVALYFAGGYAPNADQKKSMDAIINGTATPNQVLSFLKTVGRAGVARLGGINEQFRTMMGHDDPNILDSDARLAAEHLGLTIPDNLKTGGQLGKRHVLKYNPATGKVE